MHSRNSSIFCISVLPVFLNSRRNPEDSDPGAAEAKLLAHPVRSDLCKYLDHKISDFYTTICWCTIVYICNRFPKGVQEEYADYYEEISNICDNLCSNV